MDVSGPCGSHVAHFHVERFLGGGGVGAVYVARDVASGRHVALKLLRVTAKRSKERLARFEREARLASQLASDHIVQIYEFGTAPDGRAYLAMELLEGVPLDEHIKKNAPIDPVEAVSIAVQLLDALASAHSHGIVHRDLKPGNLFLTRTATDRPFLKVLDFGLSKLLEGEEGAHITSTGALLGTPRYMAPEQLKSPSTVDHRADLHAVGVILYHMLTKRFPYDGKGVENILMSLARDQPGSLGDLAPHLPAGLVSVVDRAIARDRVARWQSATEFSSALRQLEIDLDDDYPLDGPTVTGPRIERPAQDDAVAVRALLPLPVPAALAAPGRARTQSHQGNPISRAADGQADFERDFETANTTVPRVAALGAPPIEPRSIGYVPGPPPDSTLTSDPTTEPDAPAPILVRPIVPVAHTAPAPVIGASQAPIAAPLVGAHGPLPGSRSQVDPVSSRAYAKPTPPATSIADVALQGAPPSRKQIMTIVALVCGFGVVIGIVLALVLY